MVGDVSIELGISVDQIINKALSIFGKDKASKLFEAKIEKHIIISLQESSSVQCVGMDRPIPISEIYQPTRLKKSNYPYDEETISLFSLIESKQHAIILAGPGYGKTVLMHWVYMNLVNSTEIIPLLYTLRWPSAVNDLILLVEELEKSELNESKFQKSNKLKSKRIVLLVDGYDEISLEDRKKVSKALREFCSLEIGNCYLTCRTYYEIIDLSIKYYYIDSFCKKDAERYAESFLKAYGVNCSAEDLIRELMERGFSDFLGNPLLLALVCILKTGPIPNLPKNTIGLIRRSIETLTFRWDEKRGINRDSGIPLDGDERIRCLMQIAFNLPNPIGDERIVHEAVDRYISKLQRTHVNINKLLNEIAQWYGIFVPYIDYQWTFVHRTIHDYLAAKYWVEGGIFAEEVKCRRIKDWNTRAAYAACLVPDATCPLVQSLKSSNDLHIFTECLLNNALFSEAEVSKALLGHHAKFRKSWKYLKDLSNCEIRVSILLPVKE